MPCGGRGVWEFSVPSCQCCYKAKTASKLKRNNSVLGQIFLAKLLFHFSYDYTYRCVCVTLQCKMYFLDQTSLQASVGKLYWQM